jgi:hypothetical protein
LWTQNFDPAGQIFVSAGLAVIPILFLFWALAVQKLSGHAAGLLTALLAIAVAVAAYGMPLGLAVFATLEAPSGLFPIGWIVVAAVFLNLAVKSGQFDVIKESIASSHRGSQAPGAAHRLQLRRVSRRRRRIRTPSRYPPPCWSASASNPCMRPDCA